MKKYLISKHGLPSSAVIVDPHARHTTTNLRNAGRLALRMGIPADKPLLTTTDLPQSSYITILGKRCLEELGYLPWRLLTRLGDNDNCWLPAAQVLTADPRDERDPKPLEPQGLVKLIISLHVHLRGGPSRRPR